MFSHPRNLVFLLTLLYGLTAPLSAQSRRSEIDHIRHFEELKGLTVSELETPSAKRGSKHVTFSTLGRFFELEISPTRLYTPDAKIRWVTESGEYVDEPESRHYRGRIVGEDGSWARMIVTPDTMEAIIRSGDEIYFVRPGNRLIPTLSRRTLLSYRLSDVDSLWDEYSCALDSSVPPGQKRRSPSSSRSAMDDFQALVSEAQIQSEALSLKEVEIHVVADGAYYSAQGSGAAARMETVINDMAGIYENEVGVTYRISASTIYTPATDPFTSSTDYSVLLDSFTGTSHSSGHDLAHLFTGRDLDGSVVGVAWLGVVCHGSHNTGLSQDLGSATYRMLVTAHEVGHNFDAIHDGNGGCSSTPSGFIMWPSLNPAATTFSDCSKSDMNNHIASRSCLSDFVMGGQRSDTAVWRPSGGTWHIIRSSDGSGWGTQYGTTGDIPVPADYDGDSITDIAVWRPSNGVWYVIRSSDGSRGGTQYGTTGDIPVPADYDGDSITDIAVWRPSNGVWYVTRSSDGSRGGTQYGTTGDIPVPADYDGDSITDIAVWRPSNGVWYVTRSSDGSRGGTQYGTTGDIPVPADYDGDSITDIAVWRPSNGVWYVTRSSDGSRGGTQYGTIGDTPVPADYDGDSITDIAVWRPSNGVWYVTRSSDGSRGGTQYGTIGDIPVPADYDGD